MFREHRHELAALFHLGQGVAAIARDEGVDDASVGLDRCDGDAATLVSECAGLVGGLGTVGERLLVRLLGVEDREGDVLDAVAVEPDLLGSPGAPC